MVVKIIVGILGTLFGLAMLIKTPWFLSMLGRNAWAESKFGYEGGSRLLYKLIGLIIIFITWTYVFNWLNGLLEFFLGGLFRR